MVLRCLKLLCFLHNDGKKGVNGSDPYVYHSKYQSCFYPKREAKGNKASLLKQADVSK